MRRICVIGDSHVGALKFGWDDLGPGLPGTDLSFFGTSGGTIGDIHVEDGRLVGKTQRVRDFFRRTSGGKEAVDPADYDGFVLVGMGVGLHALLRFYTRCHIDTHERYKGRYFISRDLFRAIAARLLSRRRSMHLHGLLRGITDRPITIVTEPLPSEDFPASPAYDAEIRSIFSDGYDGDVAAIYEEAIAALRAEGYAIVTQPDETRWTASLTRRQFSAGSRRSIGSQHSEGECLHMNRLYGAAIVERLLASPPDRAPGPTCGGGR